MDSHQQLLHRLAQPASSRMVLLVLDGVGDIRNAAQPQTALEAAQTPNLDALAARSALGRLTPTAPGVTPGSGPGHLALFGYDPTLPAADIGRGVLEALGLGLQLGPGDIAARGNFATVDLANDARNLLDRRAGRPPTEECRRVCAKIRTALENDPSEGLEVQIEPGEAHRFVLILRGEGLSGDIADTDPQKLGVPAAALTARSPESQTTVRRLGPVLEKVRSAIADEPQMNEILLRGFSGLPGLPQLGKLYAGLRCGAFAGYPLYRGVAGACGMEVIPCGKYFSDIVETVGEHWDRFELFFLHVKQTDQAGEDGNLQAKVDVLEKVDAALPKLLKLEPDVVAITGDHSTPAPMAAHSWHPVPLLLHGPNCYADDRRAFNEEEAISGHLGTLPARYLMGLMLANAGRLKKFGA